MRRVAHRHNSSAAVGATVAVTGNAEEAAVSDNDESAVDLQATVDLRLQPRPMARGHSWLYTSEPAGWGKQI
jgi:hypothetical protein